MIACFRWPITNKSPRTRPDPRRQERATTESDEAEKRRKRGAEHIPHNRWPSGHQAYDLPRKRDIQRAGLSGRLAPLLLRFFRLLPPGLDRGNDPSPRLWAQLPLLLSLRGNFLLGNFDRRWRLGAFHFGPASLLRGSDPGAPCGGHLARLFGFNDDRLITRYLPRAATFCRTRCLDARQRHRCRTEQPLQNLVELIYLPANVQRSFQRFDGVIKKCFE